jgi:hypothetical protein
VGAGRVAVVATWQGWCGACADERPLVLTRSGRRSVRSWWAGLGDDHLALTLTCRLCGVGVDVPLHEEDDVDPVEVEAAPDLRSVQDPVEAPVAADVTAVSAPLVPEEPVPAEQPVAAEPVAPTDVLAQARAALAARRLAAEQAAAVARCAEDAGQLRAARSVVAGAVAALVAQQSAATAYPGDLTSEQALHLLSGGLDALPAAAAS